MKNAVMDKGDSVIISSLPQPITITNVDNAPTFDYDIPELKADYTNPTTGDTKVHLKFEVKGTGVKWDTSDCWAGNVVLSGGWESWSCDYSCNQTAPAAREL